jgi:hypothetical protein
MKKLYFVGLLLAVIALFNAGFAFAQAGEVSPSLNEEDPIEATSSATVLERVTPTPLPRTDLTRETEESVEPLKRILDTQEVGDVFPFNPIKYAIRAAIDAGVPPNTLVLLLLLPGVAALIAATRHLVGIRGFGIFLPAALSVVFVATGPLPGIGLFLVIVFVSTAARMILRRLKIKLQYLPRMALILHFVVLGILLILFSAPYITSSGLVNVSIFPVLILVLLAEDFSRVQLGKSAKVAINLTAETLILALISYIFLSLKFIQEFALLKPEIWILSIIIFDLLLGKYAGLRFMEIWRFRKLISK